MSAVRRYRPYGPRDAGEAELERRQIRQRVELSLSVDPSDILGQLLKLQTCIRCKRPFRECRNMDEYKCFMHPGRLSRGVWTCCEWVADREPWQNSMPGCTPCHCSRHPHTINVDSPGDWLTAVPSNYIADSSKGKTGDRGFVTFNEAGEMRSIVSNYHPIKGPNGEITSIDVDPVIVANDYEDETMVLNVRAPPTRWAENLQNDVRAVSPMCGIKRLVTGKRRRVKVQEVREESKYMRKEEMREKERAQAKELDMAERRTQAAHMQADFNEAFRDVEDDGYDRYFIFRRVAPYIDPERDDYYWNNVEKYVYENIQAGSRPGYITSYRGELDRERNFANEREKIVQGYDDLDRELTTGEKMFKAEFSYYLEPKRLTSAQIIEQDLWD